MKVVLKKMRAFSAGAAVKIGAGYFRTALRRKWAAHFAKLVVIPVH